MVKKRIHDDTKKQFDLIFMDMHMPVMDGLEASEKITQLGLDIPIVAITANIMTHDRELYKESGMKDYVGKPFTSQELWHCLLKYFKPVTWQTEEEKETLEQEKKQQQRIMKNFLKNNRDKVVEVKEAIKANDIKLAHRLVHTLKSNAGQLGETQLQQIANEIENNLKDGKDLTTAQQIEDLENELSAVLAALEPLIEDTVPVSEDKLLDNDAACKLLDELKPLLEDADMDCMALVDKLSFINGSEELIDQMENFDFTTAAETLEKLKKELSGN